ncbi:alpha-N-acetyl-neuraminyl-2,3-beta-galactosyl-1,3-N-acetyl-galactosaminide alpha-2,6-sialyltransferase-like [Glandiceps talaboti]
MPLLDRYMAATTRKGRKCFQIIVVVNGFLILAVILSSWKYAPANVKASQRPTDVIAANQRPTDVIAANQRPTNHTANHTVNPGEGTAANHVTQEAVKVLRHVEDNLKPNVANVTDNQLHGYVAIADLQKHLEHRRCGECAIVSSSGRILGRNAAGEIDSTDCVIRMNDAPVKGYEHEVGRRTSIRIISFASIGMFDPSALFHPSTSSDIVIFWGPPDQMSSDNNGSAFYTISKYQKSFSHIKFYKFTNEKLDEMHKRYEKETSYKIGPIWASTGWFTMMFSLEICDKITIYGMTNPSFCRNHPYDQTWYHYYSKAYKECSRFNLHERSPKNVHKYKTERSVFSRWNKSKVANITFRHPSW